MVTVTIEFSSKEQAINWLGQYEGGIEQSFDEVQSNVDMKSYIPEMQEFKTNDSKNNFNLKLDKFEE